MTVIDRQSKIFKILDLAENCVRGSIFISRIMAQPDFATLAIKDELSDERQNHKEFSIRANEGCISYVPVNFIPEEVCAFIAAWDASTLTFSSSSSDTTLGSASVPFSQHDYEPARRQNDFAPPKRFYRTFWRSVSRRILALSKAQNKVGL